MRVAGWYVEGADVRWFGSKGDSGTTNDGPALAAALGFGYFAHCRVHAPAAGRAASGIRGYYRSDNALPLFDGATFTGDGPWRSELRFTNDTNGFYLADAASDAFTTNIQMSGFHIRGNADVSLDSTATVAFLLKYINHSTFRDIWIQDFVDSVTVDAGDVGAVMTTFDRVQISMLKSPNETNGYPRFGLSLIGGTAKPQGIMWLDSCRVYAEESVEAQDYNGDGSTVDFDIDLTAKGGLYRTQGLQVYLVNATSGEPEKKTEGSDYDLYDVTGGSEVAIPTGDTYVGADVVRVKFSSAPASGTDNVRLYWSDSTGEVGVRVLSGSGNYIGGLVGGWDINCYLNDQQNVANFIYSQIARVGIQLTANATDCVARVGERTDASIYEKHIDRHENAVGSVLLHGTPAFTQKAATGDQSGSGTTTTTMALAPGDDYVRIDAKNPGTWREIEADIEVDLSNTGDHAVADLNLDYSHDNGNSWTTLLSRRLETKATGVSGVSTRQTVRMKARDTEYLHPSRGNLKQPRYRVQIAGVDANDSWVIKGGGDYESFLRAREVNPD